MIHPPLFEWGLFVMPQSFPVWAFFGFLRVPQVVPPWPAVLCLGPTEAPCALTWPAGGGGLCILGKAAPEGGGEGGYVKLGGNVGVYKFLVKLVCLGQGIAFQLYTKPSFPFGL